VPVPPAQVQAIVDKLAVFVQKNGIQFEVRPNQWLTAATRRGVLQLQPACPVQQLFSITR
jgi:hypothetical protein